MHTRTIPTPRLLTLFRALAAGLLTLAAMPAQSALNVYLELTANGESIAGETTLGSVGGLDVTDMIECHAVNHEMFASFDTSTGRLTGQLNHAPFKIVKRVDKASPLIAKALSNNEVIEARFRYFRPNPSGDGTTQQYFTIELSGGRVSGLRHWTPNNLDPAGSAYPYMEEVSFVYERITIRYEDGGIEHLIDVSAAQ